MVLLNIRQPDQASVCQHVEVRISAGLHGPTRRLKPSRSEYFSGTGRLFRCPYYRANRMLSVSYPVGLSTSFLQGRLGVNERLVSTNQLTPSATGGHRRSATKRVRQPKETPKKAADSQARQHLISLSPLKNDDRSIRSDSRSSCRKQRSLTHAS